VIATQRSFDFGMCLIGCPALIALALLSAARAASSLVEVGKTRPPIAETEVTVYLSPPAHYEQIAIIDASSEGSM
jgi:hypothetical protein